MDDMTPAPQPELKPFAGREALYARLYQHALDPPERRALVITGRDGSGKTALLKQFDRVFDDTLLSLYVPLHDMPLDDRDDWLQWLVDGTNQLLTRYDFSLYRLPQWDDAPSDDTRTDDNAPPLREWVRETYLPEVFRVIRPQRRLVWLFDDADVLLNENTGSHLAYLHELLQAHEQLALVLTLPIAEEDHLPQLVPLVNPTQTERLYPLNETDTGVLMRQFAPGLSDEAVSRIHRETGGQPLLLQRYGQALASDWQSKPDSVAIAAAARHTYQASYDDFRERWLRLERDERLVLTAIAGLLYDRPARTVTTSRIEKWLIETDFPLDVVAINAALRSLDYREMVRNSPEAITLRTGFLQTWLIEHARLDDTPERVESSSFDVTDWRLWLAIGGGALLLLILLLVLSAGLSPGDPGLVVPTVTVSGR